MFKTSESYEEIEKLLEVLNQNIESLNSDILTDEEIALMNLMAKKLLIAAKELKQLEFMMEKKLLKIN
jgi:hypothetical protein